MVPHDEADGGRPALQVQRRNPGGMRHGRNFAEHAGLSLLLQGRAGVEHVPGAQERGREGCPDVFRLLERMVPRSLAADRRGAPDFCSLNRQSGIKRACSSPSGHAKSGRAAINLPDGGGMGLPLWAGVTKGRGMSTFDDPLDSERELTRSGCVCEQQRSEGVVASAVVRAMFPKDAARRAFLKSVGASTALAAISQFFPIKAATEAFAQNAPLEKKDLKVG